MARQVRTETGWSEGSDHKFTSRTRLLGFIHNVLGPHHCAHGSASSITYGRVEDFRAPLGSAPEKEAETLLRARMLQ
jgi:hypothetical protein